MLVLDESCSSDHRDPAKNTEQGEFAIGTEYKCPKTKYEKQSSNNQISKLKIYMDLLGVSPTTRHTVKYHNKPETTLMDKMVTGTVQKRHIVSTIQ